jgi:hypothetical protein
MKEEMCQAYAEIATVSKELKNVFKWFNHF